MSATQSRRGRPSRVKANDAAPRGKAVSEKSSETGKRALSPQPDSENQPLKRKKGANGAPVKKPAKKATPPKKTTPPKKATTSKKMKAAPPQSTNGRKATTKTVKPALNPIPQPPEHTRPANQIFVWGAGNFGQFGMGPDHLGEFEKPKKNPWIEKKMGEGAFGDDEAGIEAIAAGGLHTMFIDEKGSIWTCGVNDDAALGRITKDVPDPDKEGAFINIDILTSIPHPLQTLIDEQFRAVSIAAGDSICAAISSEGELRVWGSFRANEGSLGFSGGSRYQFIPIPILQFPARDEEKISSVAAGNNHLVVLTTRGCIYTWGAGEQGQLGRKIIERRKIHGTNPEKVTLGSRLRKAVVIGAGNYASFAVDEKGDVWGWGLNTMGQAGTGYEGEGDQIVQQPERVFGLSKEELGGATITKIAGGEHHTLFLSSDGRVFACGRANGGQLGLPSTHDALKSEDYQGFVAEPTLVPFPDSDDPIVHISAGTHNNLAVSAAGALYAWGQGEQGELGTGDATDVPTPRMIVRREGGSWKAITAECGGQHSLGLFRKKVVD